jgi:uncharacterized protein (TIGR02466 family)
MNIQNYNIKDTKITEIQPFVNSIYAVETLNLDLSKVNSYVDKLQQQDVWFDKITGGKQTDNLLVNEYPEFKYVFDAINPIAEHIIRSWGIADRIIFHHFIVNVDGGNDYVNSHCHHNSIMSGIFYVSVPEGSGNITFERPDNQECFFKATHRNPYSFSTYTLPPGENMLLLFPSFIKHRVEMHKIKNNAKRISIAFDYSPVL